MRVSCLSLPQQFQICLRSICCLALVAGSVPMTANENFLSKPPEEWTAAEALQVLNDSPWARVVTTTVRIRNVITSILRLKDYSRRGWRGAWIRCHQNIRQRL